MFTGIVDDIGEITRVEARENGVRAAIRCSYDLETVAIGASISCAGACLTVVARDAAAGVFEVDASAETLSKTTLGRWAPGRRINLERALKVGDELGGHIVTGHVDGVGRVADITPDGESRRIAFAAPRALAPYIAAKGSIALDGCSMTVNTVEDTPDACVFSVNVIPHTQSVTTLSALDADALVNLEIDVLARYVKRMNDAAA